MFASQAVNGVSDLHTSLFPEMSLSTLRNIIDRYKALHNVNMLRKIESDHCVCKTCYQSQAEIDEVEAQLKGLKEGDQVSSILSFYLFIYLPDCLVDVETL